MSATDLTSNTLTVIKSKMWGRFIHPRDNVIVRLPAYPEARDKYVKKGYQFVDFCDDSTPLVEVYMTEKALDKIAPAAAKVADTKPEPEAPVTPDPEIYVAEKPYVSKRKPKRKYTRRQT
jgi:hypothetical protein